MAYIGLLLFFLPLLTQAKVPIRMASDPALSPDGKQIAFFWRGVEGVSSVEGGGARQRTRHPAIDRQPAWSPDGKHIAFVSEREGGQQVWVMPAWGGAPRKITLHTEGFILEEWMPDGKSLLTSITRDHFWRRGERFSIIQAGGKQKAEQEKLKEHPNR